MPSKYKGGTNSGKQLGSLANKLLHGIDKEIEDEKTKNEKFEANRKRTYGKLSKEIAKAPRFLEKDIDLE